MDKRDQDTTEAIVALLMMLQRDLTGSTLSLRLGELTDRLRSGSMTTAEFQGAFRAELGSSYLRSYVTGAAATNPQATVAVEDINAIGRLLDVQTPFIAGLAEDVVAKKAAAEVIPGEAASTNEFGQRLDMYAEGTRTANQAGRLSGMLVTGGMLADIYWDGEDDNGTCEPCAGAIEGSPYTWDTLPGLPGYPFCDGGASCRCRLSGSIGGGEYGE